MNAGILAAGSWAAGGDRIRLAFVQRDIPGRRIRKLPLEPQRGRYGLSIMDKVGRLNCFLLRLLDILGQRQYGVCLRPNNACLNSESP